MPETYGIPEPEPTRAERAERIVTQAVAGRGIVRRTVLYIGMLTSLFVMAIGTPFPLSLAGVLAGVTIVLLMATDDGLGA